jgi:fermentation-respiration switch protein FrsA (DUF1100 family)
MTKPLNNPEYLAGRANVAARNPQLPTGDTSHGADNWYTSTTVVKQSVSFPNVYGMQLAGNLFTSKNLDKNVKHAALIVGAPNGAVKEQSANLYATKLAEAGFVTLAFDQVFWGASDGRLRNAMAPDLYSESFSAGADYLGQLAFVDAERIGVLGICASGSFAINEAKIDTRLKAIDAHSDAFATEFYDFYRTQRGAADTTTHPTLTTFAKLLNFYSLSDIETIAPRPLLFVAGDRAMSLNFSEEAYANAAEPKELYKVAGAGHVDLYDRTEQIPFGKLSSFFSENL